MVVKRFMMAAQLLGLALTVLHIEESQAIRCPPHCVYGIRSPCYNNCDNLNATACYEERMEGCMCNDEGLVFQSKDSAVCVPIGSCQVTCPENSHFVECYKQPRLTCATLGKHYQQSEFCMPRCVCDPGYVLSVEANPQCVKEKTCPKFTRK